MHEASLHPENWFATFTYDDKNYKPGLFYRDFQLFVRSLRKKVGYFDVTQWQWLPRYFTCGEYGSINQRPHFHSLLFGTVLRDVQPFGSDLYRSPLLEKLWPHGYSSVGHVTYESAGYVARYSVKKVSGSRADPHYTRVDLSTGEFVRVCPEFAHMSLKPGIGYGFFQKYWREMHSARDGVVLPGGRTVPSPRYYHDKLLEIDPDLREWRDYTRYINSKNFAADCTPERLATREKCALARVNQKMRTL